jgi:murein DD-endopeptidase MepM/ murein hydrolase activator NlpD
MEITSISKEGETIILRYCHLTKPLLEKDFFVHHGEVIALSGSTGNAGKSYYDKDGLKLGEYSPDEHGIYDKYHHVHIEVYIKGVRSDAERFMKTKFDDIGNPIK